MPKPYKHLSQEEREVIAARLSEGASVGDIAKAVGRNKSTISRELRRNSPPERRRYVPCRAHARACERKKTANQHERLKNDFIRQYVKDGLAQGWSPEQISGRIRIDHPEQTINHEAIYQYIYHPQNPDRLEMIQLLRQAHKKRRNKGIGRKVRRTTIPNRIPIDDRPKSVENRGHYGHWEGDSMISRKSKVALNTLVERKSRLVLITKLPRRALPKLIKRLLADSRSSQLRDVKLLRWTTEPKMPSTSIFPSSLGLDATLPAPMHPGNGVRMRTSMGSFVGTCQRELISVKSRPSR
jgi:IS30 family transposase